MCNTYCVKSSFVLMSYKLTKSSIINEIICFDTSYLKNFETFYA